MARGNQTFQKRQRENKLREKAQQKRERRQQKQVEKKQAQVLGAPQSGGQAIPLDVEGVDGSGLAPVTRPAIAAKSHKPPKF